MNTWFLFIRFANLNGFLIIKIFVFSFNFIFKFYKLVLFLIYAVKGNDRIKNRFNVCFSLNVCIKMMSTLIVSQGAEKSASPERTPCTAAALYIYKIIFPTPLVTGKFHAYT